MRIKKLAQRGDTIMEVLISVTVLSLVLTTTFALANKSSQGTRQAAERSEASKTAQAEMEKLKLYLSSTDLSTIAPGSYFCVNSDGTTTVALTPTGNPAQNDDINFTDAVYTNPSCQTDAGVKYYRFIQRGTGADSNIFTAYVKWPSINGKTVDKVSFAHKVYSNPAAGVIPVTNPTSLTPAPTTTLTVNGASSATVTAPSSVTMSWSSPTATSCTASGAAAWIGPKAAPSGSQVVTLPISATPYTLNLTCSNDGGAGPVASVTVRVNAPPPIQAGVSPASRSFPAWHLRNTGGVPFNQTFTITGNPSSGPLQLTSVGISGPNADNFQIIGNNCTNGVLTGAQSCVVIVQFYPPSGGGFNRLNNSGNKSATLTVNSVLGPINASLAGRSLSDQMLPGDVMYMGQYLRSYNPACYNNADACGHILVLQFDTNLVLYPNATVPHSWCTCRFTPNPVFAVMQGDGHFVVYDAVSGAPIWYGAMAMGWTYWAGDWLLLYNDFAALNQLHYEGTAHYNFAPWGGIYH